MADKRQVNFPKEKYQKIMSENLALLRKKLKLSQSDLAQMLGISRYTISLIERGERIVMWEIFLALMFVFRTNEATSALLPIIGLQTPELMAYLNVANLKKLK